MDMITIDYLGTTMATVTADTQLRDIEIPWSVPTRQAIDKIDKKLAIARAKADEQDARVRILEIQRDLEEIYNAGRFWLGTMLLPKQPDIPEHIYYKVEVLRSQYFSLKREAEEDLFKAKQSLKEARQRVKQLTTNKE